MSSNQTGVITRLSIKALKTGTTDIKFITDQTIKTSVSDLSGNNLLLVDSNNPQGASITINTLSSTPTPTSVPAPTHTFTPTFQPTSTTTTKPTPSKTPE